MLKKSKEKNSDINDILVKDKKVNINKEENNSFNYDISKDPIKVDKITTAALSLKVNKNIFLEDLYFFEILSLK